MQINKLERFCLETGRARVLRAPKSLVQECHAGEIERDSAGLSLRFLLVGCCCVCVGVVVVEWIGCQGGAVTGSVTAVS